MVEEEVIYLDVSPDGLIKKGDLVLLNAQSAGHAEYIKNNISGNYQLVGKVHQYVEKTYFQIGSEEPYMIQTYLDLRYPPVRLPDKTIVNSPSSLAAINECSKILAAEDPDVSKLDSGTKMNVKNHYRFIYGRWMMRYMFGWDFRF